MGELITDVFMSPAKRRRKEKDAEVYDEFLRLSAIEGASITQINEYLMKKYDIFSLPTLYNIRKREAARRAAEQ